MKKTIFLIIISVFVFSCSNNEETLPVVDESVKQNIELVKGKRIFFGHQSVGFNIIEGLKEISNNSINFVNDKSQLDSNGFFFDSRIGKNSDPNFKCDDFSNIIDDGLHKNLDYALMKFCYVDIKKETVVDDVFNHYSKVIDTLKAKYNEINFVHVTVPLNTRGPAWKRIIKNIMGDEEFYDIVNKKRCEFNNKLKAKYKDDIVYDLAKAEYTKQDGSLNEYMLNDNTYYSLAEEYTYDGGHLNALGRQVMATELVNTISNHIKNSK